MRKLFEEFKTFAIQGSVFDVAVGVIIASAFGRIVTSIVNDIIMPPIGWLIGGVDFSDLKVTLPAVKTADGLNDLAEATINYGSFIQTIINFIIIAFCVFLLVKGLTAVTSITKKPEEEAPTPPAEPEPSAEEKLLTEIRDLLKKD